MTNPSRTLAAILAIATLAASPAPALGDEPPAGDEEQPEHKLTKAPKLAKFVEAIYPPDKEKALVTAKVLLSIEIGADGKVGEVGVVESGGPDFDAAAVAACKQFVFEPAEIDNQPAPVKITYRYNFTIKEQIVKLGPQINFEGTILERFRKVKLGGVKVTIKDLNLTTTTNAEGYFSFVDVPPGVHKVETAAPSLVTQSTDETIEAGKRKTVKYQVEEKDPGADMEVVVRAPRIKKESVETTIRTEEARRVPGTQGDTLKVVQNLPGVARSSFGSGQLVVWGSAPSDTQVFVNGVQISALYHVGGLRSTVNSDLVKSIELSPGAYGADYGGGLGGLVKVETRALQAEGIHGYVAADIMDASGMISAAIGKRLRVAIAGRYSYLDRVLPLVTKADFGDFFPIPRYDDYQAEATLALRKDEELTALFLASDDFLKRSIASQDPASVRSEITDSSFKRILLRYSRLLEDGSSLQVTPFVGWDDSLNLLAVGPAPEAIKKPKDCVAVLIGGSCVGQSTVRYGLRAAFRRKLEAWATLAAGADIQGRDNEVSRQGTVTLPAREGDITVFGQRLGDEITLDTWKSRILSAAPYALVELRAGPLTVTPGLRLEAFYLEGDRLAPPSKTAPQLGFNRLEWAFDPRLSAQVKATKWLAFNAGVGIYHQAPDPKDLSTVFGNPRLALSTAYHYTAGTSLKLTGTLTLELVGFFKQYDKLASRNAAPTPPLTQTLTQDGEGRSYGGQLLLRQDLLKGVFGWVNYSLIRSERKDHPGSDWRTFDYDQTHVLGVLVSWAIGKGVTVGARFRMATGYPRTAVTGSFYDVRTDEYQPIFGDHNGVRIPLFYQLDARVEKTFNWKGGSLNVFLDVQNVTNRSNPEEIIYNYDYTKRSYISGLPTLAVLGLRLEGDWTPGGSKK